MKMRTAMLLLLAVYVACAAACTRVDEVRDGEGKVIYFGNGVNIWVDPDTGCNYLVYSEYNKGAMTPRLNPNGTPYCSGR